MWTAFWALVLFYVATLAGFLWAMRFAQVDRTPPRMIANDNIAGWRAATDVADQG